MILSRRQFLERSSMSVVAAPVLMSFDIDYCEAAGNHSIDLSMGFPQGAIRLNFNENILGPSPLAIEGAKAGLAEGYRYALGGLLTPLLAEHHGIDKEWLLMGTGSTELQRLLPATHLRDGENVVSGVETWGGGLLVAENMGITVKRVPLLKEQGYSFDLQAMLDAVDANTRIFLVVSPNNPTGASASYEQLRAVADALPKNVLFIIDEAYADYLPDDRKTGIDLVKDGYENVVVTRTFSKAHGMAGLRTGYGIGHPDILATVQKYGCGPASTSIVAFGAVQGALSDTAHARKSREYVEKTRLYYQRQARALGLETVAGVPPFMLIELGDTSSSVHEELKNRKILVSHGSSWGLPDYLRVSYGREAENAAFFRELKTIL